MANFYNYICPICGREEEEKSCYISSKVYKSFLCPSCKEFFMYEQNQNNKEEACVECGNLNIWKEWDYRCPTCGALMKKYYALHKHNKLKVIQNNNDFFCINLINNDIIKVKEYIEISKYIRKFCIDKDGMELWGILDNYNYVIIPPKYLELNVNEFGQIQVVYPNPSEKGENTDIQWILCKGTFFYEEIDLECHPIKRFYNSLNNKVDIIKYFDIDAIGYNDSNISNYLISIRKDKMGIVRKDGLTIVNPILDYIEKDCFSDFQAFIVKLKLSMYIYPNTYGEGLIAIKERDGISGKGLWSLVDKDFNKIIIFDESWSEKNDLPCTPRKIIKYNNGFWEILLHEDEYEGYVYTIDILGNTQFKEKLFYKTEEFNLWDYIESGGYDGYEELDYYNISDPSLREALDDDPEALGNLD